MEMVRLNNNNNDNNNNINNNINNNYNKIIISRHIDSLYHASSYTQCASA